MIKLLMRFYTIVAVVIFASYTSSSLAAEVELTLSDIEYGGHKLQTFDVYKLEDLNQAPTIVMVHGGAWRTGDKANKSVYKDKVERWVKKGFVFISVNYRLLPEARPFDQANDVAIALAYIQQNAKSWGADPEKIILMGHSAGAHLVTLLATSNSIRNDHDVRPWLGTVAIDSAVFNVTSIMQKVHPKFYDKAFGDDQSYWRATSPFFIVNAKNAPLLAICSELRKDDPCVQAKKFQKKAAQFEMSVDVLPVKYSHSGTNKKLGKNNRYTRNVERFMRRLDRKIADHLR